MGKNKVQETMANSTPHISSSCLMVITISSFRKLVAIITAYISDFFWKITTCTSTNLLISWSYVWPSNSNQYATSSFR